jgi:hypothetical protein
MGDDVEDIAQECEDAEFRNHSILLHKGARIIEKLEAIGEIVEEVELVMTTLNGLPRS